VNSTTTLRKRILSGDIEGLDSRLVELFAESDATYNQLNTQRSELINAVKELEFQINSSASECEGILKAIEVTSASSN